MEPKLLEWAGGQGEVLADPHHLRSDARMVAEAIRKRWPIDDEIKKRLLDMGQFWLFRCTSARDYAAIASFFGAAEKQNQADEMKAEEYARLDSGKPTANVQHVLRSDTPLLARAKPVNSREIQPPKEAR